MSLPSDPAAADMTNSLHREVMTFPTPCPHCGASTETNMRITDIPHFKEVIIMSLHCEHCGYKSNEVKGGGAVPAHGTNITLHVKGEKDLAREVIKSNTAGVSVPELELELEEGGLDGMYTTVEGLLSQMHDRLSGIRPFGGGDSSKAPSTEHVRYILFLSRLKGYAMGEIFPFTLVISDPLSNSFVGPVQEVAELALIGMGKERSTSSGCHGTLLHDEDGGLEVKECERTDEQNESLGLNDMRT